MPPTVSPRPEWVISALGRAGYGARPEDLSEVIGRGFPDWVTTQLAPRETDDRAVHERLARLKLRIRYGANPKWPAVDEQRYLGFLDKPIEEAWTLIVQRGDMDGAERRRPRDEVTA